MFKSPKRKNKSTGNVCYTHEKFADLFAGQTMVIDGKYEVFTKTIEQWMLDAAKDMGDYILVPYSKGSWVYRKYLSA